MKKINTVSVQSRKKCFPSRLQATTKNLKQQREHNNVIWTQASYLQIEVLEDLHQWISKTRNHHSFWNPLRIWDKWYVSVKTSVLAYIKLNTTGVVCEIKLSQLPLWITITFTINKNNMNYLCRFTMQTDRRATIPGWVWLDQHGFRYFAKGLL